MAHKKSSLSQDDQYSKKQHARTLQQATKQARSKNTAKQTSKKTPASKNTASSNKTSKKTPQQASASKQSSTGYSRQGSKRDLQECRKSFTSTLLVSWLLLVIYVDIEGFLKVNFVVEE